MTEYIEIRNRKCPICWEPMLRADDPAVLNFFYDQGVEPEEWSMLVGRDGWWLCTSCVSSSGRGVEPWWWESGPWRRRKSTRRSGRPRDSQRSKLYRAENVIRDGARDWDDGEIQSYVDAITRKVWWKRRGPKVVRVEPWGWMRNNGGRAFSWKGWYGPTIKVPRDTSVRLILHELAHLMKGSMKDGAHGRAYARNYLALVRWHLGDEAWRELRDSFRRHKVKWYAKRGPQPERKLPEALRR